MTLLLDTHVWLWLNLSPDKLPAQFVAAMEDPDNELIVSVVSVWELSIKERLGKIALGEPWLPFIEGALEGVRLIEVRLPHVERVHKLPPIHRDPFDRMIVAQAFAEGFTLLTVDKSIIEYGVHSLPA